MHLYNTHGICEFCARHLPAEVHDRDGKIVMDKECPEHGKSTVIIMNDSKFYHDLTYNKQGHRYRTLDSVLFEVTNKCNLACPDCYQIPDNKSIDKPPFKIVDEIKSLGDDKFTVTFAGAEPTVSKNIIETLAEVRGSITNKEITFLTNGIKFADRDFTQALIRNGLAGVHLGLNHLTYQGEVVHNKQLQGIANLAKENLTMQITYTVEKYEHLSDVILEILDLKKQHDSIEIFKVRMGSNIGRVGNAGFKTLSDNFNEFVTVCNQLKLPWYIENEDNNIYHIMVNVNGAPIRVIQWPDASNLNLHETKTGPWCNFYNGPVTNFLHQIIMRDMTVNKGLTLHDTVPIEYTRSACIQSVL
jgi:MoaA/NifB/PqqE/SkfB family radical SAM enzyme